MARDLLAIRGCVVFARDADGLEQRQVVRRAREQLGDAAEPGVAHL